MPDSHLICHSIFTVWFSVWFPESPYSHRVETCFPENRTKKEHNYIKMIYIVIIQWVAEYSLFLILTHWKDWLFPQRTGQNPLTSINSHDIPWYPSFGFPCGFWRLSLAKPAETVRKTGPGGFGNLGPGLVGTGMKRSFGYRGFISIHIWASHR